MNLDTGGGRLYSCWWQMAFIRKMSRADLAHWLGLPHTLTTYKNHDLYSVWCLSLTILTITPAHYLGIQIGWNVAFVHFPS